MPGIMLSMLHLILTATKDIIIFNVMYYQKTEIPETLSNLPEVMELVSVEQGYEDLILVPIS